MRRSDLTIKEDLELQMDELSERLWGMTELTESEDEELFAEYDDLRFTKKLIEEEEAADES